MRKEFCHHTQDTMSAKSRTAAGSREQGRPRAAQGVFCAIPPQRPPAQSHLHPFFLSLPGSVHNCTHTRFFCLSQEVCVEFVSCCLVSDRIFGSTLVLHADPSKPRATAARQAFYLARHEFLGLSLSLFYLATHTNSLACLLSMTSQPPRGRGAAAPRSCTAAFVTGNTRIPSSQQPSCICTRQTQVT